MLPPPYPCYRPLPLLPPPCPCYRPLALATAPLPSPPLSSRRQPAQALPRGLLQLEPRPLPPSQRDAWPVAAPRRHQRQRHQEPRRQSSIRAERQRQRRAGPPPPFPPPCLLLPHKTTARCLPSPLPLDCPGGGGAERGGVALTLTPHAARGECDARQGGQGRLPHGETSRQSPLTTSPHHLPSRPPLSTSRRSRRCISSRRGAATASTI